MSGTIFVGIDVSLKSNAVCVLNSQGKKLNRFSVRNDREGTDTIVKSIVSCMSKVENHPQAQIGIEATSVYGFPLLYLLKQETSLANVDTHYYILNPKES